jgi:ribosomal protein S18 acetylase RimI-like enzyme
MITIRKATVNDVKQLAIVSKKAFFIPHQHVIPKEIMGNYLKESFSEENLTKEVTQENYEYHLIFYKEELAGFSKVILNTPNEHLKDQNVTKMERLYLVEEFYGLGLGKKLFDYNLDLTKKNNQKGIWLYVWIKNYRALKFYEKVGFKKIALYDFPISDTETRPNDVLFLDLS